MFQVLVPTFIYTRIYPSKLYKNFKLIQKLYKKILTYGVVAIQRQRSKNLMFLLAFLLDTVMDQTSQYT